ncbi:Cryptic sugar kinase Mak [hydrothermal vent metagenome]|uniref:Cryptic sugar kinase Mak n=1 Tax=hydrothermal vent metagenome TaxID=652676 RepID=A0A3B1B4D0_9ZZZZ
MRIGIDLGGTKIEGIALADDGIELCRYRISTPRDDYPATLQAIKVVVDHLETETAVSGSVGVGIPGAISPHTQLVKNANSTWLIGEPLETDLAETLNRPVRITNDANCFTVSEATDGAAKDAEVVFGVIIGTGTGGGICINKHIVTGANAIGGEWGHNPLPWPRDEERPGLSCYCGQHGCIETFVSGTGFTRHYRAAGGQASNTQEILQALEDGETLAVQAMHDYEHRLARALASIINVLDPDVIVLGGGLSNIQRLYQNVPGIWSEFVFSDHVATRLVPPVHGDSSGVRGAAWLWPAE